MYAIVEIAGLQYRVKKDQQLLVNRLPVAEGQTISFDKVLLTDNNGTIEVGAPVIEGSSVEAKVIKHLKGDKVIVFKKKRRKGYKKKNGHRQQLSKIEITSVGGEISVKKEKVEKTAAVKDAAKPDDLKKIEGVGPKIMEVLVENGISTYAELANTKVEKISELISDVRGNHVPDTWPAQAKLAAEGKWDELKKWQDELDGGKA